MRENHYFVFPVNILTPICAGPGFFGPRDTLPYVLIHPVPLAASGVFDGLGKVLNFLELTKILTKPLHSGIH